MDDSIKGIIIFGLVGSLVILAAYALDYRIKYSLMKQDAELLCNMTNSLMDLTAQEAFLIYLQSDMTNTVIMDSVAKLEYLNCSLVGVPVNLTIIDLSSVPIS